MGSNYTSLLIWASSKHGLPKCQGWLAPRIPLELQEQHQTCCQNGFQRTDTDIFFVRSSHEFSYFARIGITSISCCSSKPDSKTLDVALILMSPLDLGQLRLHGDVVWLRTKPVSGGAADPASLPCWESNCVPKKVKSILYNILDQ